jgi:UDP-N-acetylglucosamine--N-acetylmuramyl-(pentapeptide) pyrophosphoryl-undecaprenol N-acetylglucosamine transferase
VAEITAAAKPAVFVPFPRAADDHQRVNAQALTDAGAAVLLEETDLNQVWLVDTLRALLEDSTRLEGMGEAARRLSHPNAAHDIAAMAARLAGVAVA